MIISISIIKNADDIIESFIRYNANIVDHFIIIENNSCDETLQILHALQLEGYSIEIVHEPKLENRNAERIQKQLLIAAKKYKPNFFLLLDCDELVIPSKDSSLSTAKQFIERLDPTTIYNVRWRLFFPKDGIVPQISDVTKRITSYYPSCCTAPFRKCIIPYALVDDSIKIGQGNHSVTGNKITGKVLIRDIEYAHYPCRSLEHLKAKVILSRWAYLMRPETNTTQGMHYTTMYESIKKNMVFDSDTFMKFIHEYVRFPNNKELLPSTQTVAFEGKNLIHKYTSHLNFNALEYILPYTEAIIQEYHDVLLNK